MPKTADASELKSRCSDLMRLVGAGEEIVITQEGKAVARLVPFTPEESPASAPTASRKSEGLPK